MTKTFSSTSEKRRGYKAGSVVTPTAPIAPVAPVLASVANLTGTTKRVTITSIPANANYAIREVSLNGGAYQTAGANLATSTTTFDYDVLTATSWAFRLRAVNDGGGSLDSNIVNGSVPIAPTLSIPSIISSSQVDINFSGGSGYTTLIPQYSLNQVSWTSLASDTVSPLTFTGLFANTQYFFRVLPDNDVTYSSNIVSGITSASGSIIVGGVTLPDVGTPLYVSTSGNDSNNGSIGAPKSLSLATLELAMRAGVGLIIRGGTYTPSSTLFNVINLSSAANGSSVTNWAVMKAYPGESVVINCDSNVFAYDNHHYWCVRDITFNSAGRVWMCGENFPGTNYFWADNCTFNMSTGGDNSSPVGNVGNSNMDYLWVTRCTLRGPNTPAQHHNTNAFWCGYLRHAYFVGNDVDGFTKGIYYKYGNSATSSAQVDVLCYNNKIKNCSDGGFDCEGAYVKCFDNLFYNARMLLSENETSGNDVQFYHNTCYNSTFEVSNVGGLNAVVKSNIFCGTSKLYLRRFGSTNPLTDNDYNVIQAISDAIIRSSNNYSLANYRAAFSKELNGVAGTPTFVGGATPNIAVSSDWALSPSSIGYLAGHDGTNMGCDTTKLLTCNL